MLNVILFDLFITFWLYSLENRKEILLRREDLMKIHIAEINLNTS